MDGVARNKRKTLDFRCLKWQLPCAENFSLGKLPLQSTSSKKDIFIMPRPVRYPWKFNPIQKVIIKVESCLKISNDKKRNDFLRWNASVTSVKRLKFRDGLRPSLARRFSMETLTRMFWRTALSFAKWWTQFLQVWPTFQVFSSFALLPKYSSARYEIMICNEINPEFY